MATTILDEPDRYPLHLVDQPARALIISEEEPRRTLQRFFLVEDRYSVKETAARIGWHEECLRRCIVGPRDLPAKKLPALSLATESLDFFKGLLAPLHFSLKPFPYIRSQRPIILILADLTVSFGRLYEIAEKLNRGERLTEEEQRLLQENAENAHRAIDELLDRARRREGRE